ncbi:MAG: hypothetical protein V1688_02120 [bacterium]
MAYQHKQLAAGSWQKLNCVEQLANIGSEVERTIKWKEKGNTEFSQNAFFRALELLSLSIDDEKNLSRLKELTRLYEVLVDYFAGENIYKSTDELWRKYFYSFNYLARVN